MSTCKELSRLCATVSFSSVFICVVFNFVVLALRSMHEAFSRNIFRGFVVRVVGIPVYRKYRFRITYRLSGMTFSVIPIYLNFRHTGIFRYTDTFDIPSSLIYREKHLLRDTDVLQDYKHFVLKTWYQI